MKKEKKKERKEKKKQKKEEKKRKKEDKKKRKEEKISSAQGNYKYHFFVENVSLLGPALAAPLLSGPKIDLSYLDSIFKHGALKYLGGVSVHSYTRGEPESR